VLRRTADAGNDAIESPLPPGIDIGRASCQEFACKPSIVTSTKSNDRLNLLNYVILFKIAVAGYANL
jgi:hypothetical protein